MPFGNSRVESQRDSGAKPRVARHALPWETAPQAHNPNGVAAQPGEPDATPLGLKTFRAATQGRRCAPTLGWRTQSLWDCRTADFPGIPSVSSLVWNSRKALALARMVVQGMTMKFKVVVHPEPEGGFWGEVPALPGCYSQGETVAELMDNLREAASARDRVAKPRELAGEPRSRVPIHAAWNTPLHWPNDPVRHIDRAPLALRGLKAARTLIRYT